MISFRTKAVRVFAQALVVFGVGSGLVVGCNDLTQVAKPIPSEQTVSRGSGSKSGAALTAAQKQELEEQDKYRAMSAEQREQKKREFLARPDVREASQGLDELAQMIAVAVEDKTLRDRIYEKCQERFDGATNTLWKHLEEDGKLRLNGGWNKRLSGLVDKKGSGVVKNIGNLEAAIAKFERTLNAPLHLFWEFPENWDRKTVPLVAFLPVSEGKHDVLKGYDSKGNVFQVPVELAQKRPVIVVTFNERAMVDGTLKSNVYYADGQAFHRFGQDGASLKAAGDIVLKETFFQSYADFNYDEPHGAGPPEFTCEVLTAPNNGIRLQDNYIGNVNPGYWQNIYKVNIYTNPPSNDPFILGNWGSYTQLFMKYWEDDLWFFDDYIGINEIRTTYSNPYTHQDFNPKAKYSW